MKRLNRSILILVLILLAASLSAADYSAQIEEFREYAARQMEEDQIPAMTMGFASWADGEEFTWVEGFGYSDLENKVPARPESAYRLGSVSKPMTALAVLLLAEQGKIDLDAEVQTYVPYFPKKKWPVTVRQLMGHLGGISHYKDYNTEGRIKDHKNTREALAIFDQWDLVAEPGTKYVYSSYGYNLLAAAVEGASGAPFGEFMRANIWTPLGMGDTRLDDPSDLIPNRVRGYRLMGGQIKNSEFVNISSRLGAGGARSTVPDLLKFARGVLENRIVSPKSLELIYTSMATREGEYVGYSTGWGIRPANGHFILSHTGSQQETATALFCFPALKLIIACAINQEDAGASVFVRRLFEILSGERWGLSAYVQDHSNDYRAIDSVFSYGLSHHELYRKPVSADAAEIKRAFEDFRRSIDRKERIKGRTATVLGSYMADRLMKTRGSAAVEQYHALGSIAFFGDYLKTCEARRTREYACDFPRSFRKQISEWNKSWRENNTREIRNVRVTAQTNLEETGAQLRKAFHSESAYPDYSRELGDLTWKSLLSGDRTKSLQAGELGVELYPDSARLVAMYGIALAAVSDKSRGAAFLKKAFELDPESPAEPEWLSEFVDELANAGKQQEALNVLQAGLELHPDAAELRETMEKLRKE